VFSTRGWGWGAFIRVANGGRVGNERDMLNNSCWGTTSGREGSENGGFYTPVGARGKKIREIENMLLAGRLWE
jgi:hypothetical protein